jgi:multidrug efflux pump subunit AcrA (membrane-fusion protein)
MNFTNGTGVKVLVVVVGVGVAGIVADWHLAASPSPLKSTKADSPPRIEVVHPRRATMAQRLQTNATLEAFEEADLFAKVSGYLSDVRVDIGDHVKVGQVLAVIDVPEMKQELAEAEAQLESKRSSLESARRQLDHNKADVALQNALAKDREQLGEGRSSSATGRSIRCTPMLISPRLILALQTRTATSRRTRSTSPPRR